MEDQGSTVPSTDNAVAHTDAPKAEPKPQRFRVPVDGQEMEVDLDELIRGYGHSKAANKRMQEAAAIRKAEEQRRQRAKQGDFDWVTELEADEEKVLKWAEKKLLSRMEYEQLSEPEKKLMAEQRKREQLEKQLEEMTAKERQQMEAAVLEKAYAEVDEEIGKALESFKGKKTPRLIRRVAEAMYANLEKNQAPLPSQKALEIARKSLNEDVQEYVNATPMSDLVKLFSKEQLNALRQVFVSEAKAQAPIARQAQVREQEPQAPRKSALSTDEYFKKLENKFSKRGR